MVKRKSTTNILANTLERKSSHLHHGSHSLTNSVSAKMLLAGSKAFQKTKLKEAGDKVSLNELIQKKKSVDHIKKDNIWKQMMSSKASDLKDKMIRFWFKLLYFWRSLIGIVIDIVFVGIKLGILLSLVPLFNHLDLGLVLFSPSLAFLTLWASFIAVHQRFVEFFHIDCQFMNDRPFFIESITIGPNFIDVGMKLWSWSVYSVVEVGLDCWKIHWFLDEIEVIGHSVSFGIYWG